MTQSRAVWQSIIVLYFIIGLEIVIMISPAAGFFYAAFNPVLLSLAQSPATRWLTAFFLPHMVSPPDILLQTVRVAGSILFVVGALMFFVCAGQVWRWPAARPTQGAPALSGARSAARERTAMLSGDVTGSESKAGLPSRP
jgi:hypothetical protein